MRGPPPGPRSLLRRLREIWRSRSARKPGSTRTLLKIAANMVAECARSMSSIPTGCWSSRNRRLKREAVHRASLRIGQGLVGTIAEEARPLISPTPGPPRVRYLPETGEEIYKSFLGVPDPSRRQHAGRLVVQQDAARLPRGGGRGAADDGDGARRDDRGRELGRPRPPRTSLDVRRSIRLTGTPLCDRRRPRPTACCTSARGGDGR